MKKENIEKESGSRIELINQAIREEQEKESSAASVNNEFIAKITAAFKKLDLLRSGILLAVVLFVMILLTVIIPSAIKIDYVAAY